MANALIPSLAKWARVPMSSQFCELNRAPWSRITVNPFPTYFGFSIRTRELTIYGLVQFAKYGLAVIYESTIAVCEFDWFYRLLPSCHDWLRIQAGEQWIETEHGQEAN